MRVTPSALVALLLGGAGLAIAGFGLFPDAVEAVSPQKPFPEPPASPATTARSEVAVLAGGCFWGMEGLFEHVKGVTSVTAGYAGGTRATANYPTVSSERTAHAEAVRIVFDPAKISYGRLLEVYFAVAHDPTQIEGQYPDAGHSYRSAIFPQSPAQREIAARYIATLNRSGVFSRPVATHLEAGNFYPAEAYHQHFMQRNPTHPYILRWDVPRLKQLRARFPALYRAG